MTVAYVRDAGLKVVAGFNGADNQTGSFASLPAVGNHVFVGIALFSGASDAGFNTPTDNQGNTYAEDIEYSENVLNTGAKASSTLDSCKVATSSGAFTVSINATNNSAGNSVAWTAVEFSGVEGTGVHLDRTGTDVLASGDAHVTASAANTTASGVAIGVATINNDDTDINIGDTPPSGYTTVQVNENSNAYIGFSMVYKIYSGSETSSAQWTHDNTSQFFWTAVIGTYKQSSGSSLTISKSEAIGTSENAATVLPGALVITKSEALTVSESVGVLLPGEGFSVAVTDSIVVSEITPILTTIFYVANATTDITVATASPVVTAPSGISDGDLIVIVFATNTGANAAASAGGFTRLGTEVDQGTDTTTGVLYKIASGEGASWTLTNLFDATEIGRFVALLYRNVNASPINVSEQADLGTVTTASGPSITTTTAPTMVVQFIGADPGTGAYQASPDISPVGTERFDGKDGSSNAYIAVQEYWNSAIGAIALDMTALTSDGYGGHQFAIQAKIRPFRNEIITVYESVTVEIGVTTLSISISETIGSSDTLAALLPSALAASKSETIGVSDGVSAGVSGPQVSKSESITVGEAVGEAVITEINKSETVTLAEGIGAVVATATIAVSDGSAIADTPNVNVPIAGAHSVNKSESITVGEAVGEAVVTEINKSENVTLAEGIGAVVATATITVSDGSAVADTPNVNLPIAGTYSVNKSETIGVSDSVSAGVSGPQISKSESITVGEAVGEAVVSEINKSETVTLAEGIGTVVSTATITVSDGSAIADTPNVNVPIAGTYSVNKSETIGVSDTVSAGVSGPQVSKSDAISVTESPQIQAISLMVGIQENISLAELLFRSVGVGLSVNEAISISDIGLAVLFTSYNVNVYESVNIIDGAPGCRIIERKTHFFRKYVQAHQTGDKYRSIR